MARRLTAEEACVFRDVPNLTALSETGKSEEFAKATEERRNEQLDLQDLNLWNCTATTKATRS